MQMAGVIFSNIYDASLGDLTKYRTVASLPFGGRYRQIDFVLSNMVNSGINSIGVITKYNYQSLMDHLGNCDEWDLNNKKGGLFILPPFSTGLTNIYKGKLEALNSAISFLEKVNADYIVLSDSTSICNIDYEDVLKSHIKSGADVTIVADEIKTKKEMQDDLVLTLEENDITDFEINTFGEIGKFSGMGMFIIEREYLLNVINYSLSRGLCHFEKDFLQAQFLRKNIKLNLYEFDGIVLKNRDVCSYYTNSLKLMQEEVREGLFLADSPIYTKVRDEVPTFYAETSEVSESLIADGCILEGTVDNSVIFRDVIIEQGAVVKDSIIMQGTRIKSNANIKNAIIDKDVIITEGRTLIGAPSAPIIINKGAKV